MVRDSKGRPVRAAAIEWLTSDSGVASFAQVDKLIAHAKGTCEIWARIKGTPKIEGPRIPTRVWAVDHVLLTPRTLSIPLGARSKSWQK